jgi:hypothetical protein
MMADEEIKPYLGYIDRSIAEAARVTIQPWKPPHTLTLKPCGIQIDLETGEVVIPDGLQLTDAARAFWAAVQHVSGYREPGFW